jgi:succinate dehydrogenase / fumarate reductase, cytochrome b subunit
MSASALVSYVNTTVGRKFIMALSGLGLAGFVMGHMAGNMLIFAGAEAYNTYGHTLTHSPIYPVIAVGLLACIVVHAFMGFLLQRQNMEARGGQGYAMPAEFAGKGTPVSSKTMIFSGTILFVFIWTHLMNFKWGTHYTITHSGVEMRDLHRLIIEKFQNLYYVVGYTVALIALAFHLKHGVNSLFQSLGFNHPRYTPLIKNIGILYAIVVAAGFISQPLYVYFFQRG